VLGKKITAIMHNTVLPSLGRIPDLTHTHTHTHTVAFFDRRWNILELIINVVLRPKILYVMFV